MVAASPSLLPTVAHILLGRVRVFNPFDGGSSETGTKKCQDAEAKGVEIVDEDWVREKINGNGNDEDEDEEVMPTKKSKENSASPSSGDRLSGCCFAISGLLVAICLLTSVIGTLSVPRAEFEKYILSNGGTIAKSITKACTHLVTSESGTKKCQDAEDKGVEIVDEDWVRSRVDGDEEEEGDGDGEDNDDEDSDEERGNPGDDVDISGTSIELGEPPYQRSFLKQICDRGPQYTHLGAGGDWEAWLKDLEIILPHLVNLETVEFQIPQSGCEGLVEIIELLNKCQYLRECNFCESFEREPMDVIRTLILDHPKLELLDVTSGAGYDSENEKIVVGAIKEGFEKYRNEFKLKSFAGFELSTKGNLNLLGFPVEIRNTLEGKSNTDVLDALRAQYS